MNNFLLALLMSFVIAVALSPLVIRLTKRLKFGQNILHYVESHSGKQGTPTMGGIIFILSTVIVSLCFYNNNFNLAGLVIIVFVGYAILGFLDDYLKIKFKTNLGLRAYQKVIGQVGLALIVGVYMYLNPLVSSVSLPFSTIMFRLGVFIIPYAIFIMVAASNSVNLTDGLDGLAGGVSCVFFASMGVIIYLFSGRRDIDSQWVEQLRSLIVVCGAVCGGLLGFLCFNSYKAKIFMGDTGSLSLGSLVGTVGLLSGQSLYIPIIGLMFVLSSVSVIMQVLYYKKTHKRIFLMAPLHHHFEQKGCNESKIVTIYIVITILLGVGCILLNCL